MLPSDFVALVDPGDDHHAMAGTTVAVGVWCRGVTRPALVEIGEDAPPDRDPWVRAELRGELRADEIDRGVGRAGGGRTNRAGRAADGSAHRGGAVAHTVDESVEEPVPLLRDGVPERCRGRGEMHHLCEVDGTEQQHRVDVFVTRAQAEVHDTGSVIRTGATGSTEHLSGRDALAAMDGDGGEERVRRTQPARVRDDDVQRTRDRPGDRHLARAGGPDRGTGRRPEIDAEMPGAVSMRRWCEGSCDRAGNGAHPVARRRMAPPRTGAREPGRERERAKDTRAENA